MQLSAAGAVAIIALGSCSALKRNNAESFDSGDSMPLYPVTTSTKIARTLDGHWYIKTVGSIKLSDIEDEDWPFLEFVAAEGRFYGNDGCNIINGSYRLGAAQALTLSDVATTMKLCPGDTLAYPIANALAQTASYSITAGRDGASILNLHDGNNHTLMTLRKSDIDFLNGPWQVVGVNGKSVDMPDAKLVFDVNSGRVSGCAGCNRLMGEIARNPQVSSSVQLSNLATTRMMCPDIQLESALLIALEEVVSARKAKNGHVDLLDSSGQTVVSLQKLSRKDF